MAWNEPGGSKDKDPWGNRNQDQGPPDLDEVVRKIQGKFNRLFGGGKGNKGPGGEGPVAAGGGSGAGGLGVLIVLALMLWLGYDCTYVIQPAERGVVMRFGKYTSTMEPGLNVTWPRPVGTVVRIDVDQIRNVEVGYRSSGGRNNKVTSRPSEALMLTRDENIIDVQFAVQYRIKSVSDYAFNVRNPDLTLHEATESAIREVVGKSNMDFVLTEGRSDIVARVQSLTQEILDRYKTGLVVTSVNMQDAQPPQQVQHAFDDAVKAREDEQRLINEAEAYSNDILPKARGRAARVIEEANGYKSEVIARAEGDAERFEQILTEYKKAPKVTRERLYLESMEEVLGRSSKVVVDVKRGNNMLYLPLDRMKGTGVSQTDGSSSAVAADLQAQAVAGTAAARQFLDRDRDPDLLRSREGR